MNSNEIVPFGKYKGQPIEVMQHDRGYCEWLMGQDWLQTRFPQLRTIIVNNFTEPSETPEHNALQARFLDDVFVLATIIAVQGGDGFTNGYGVDSLKKLIGVRFEDNSVDVHIYQNSSSIQITDKEEMAKKLYDLDIGSKKDDYYERQPYIEELNYYKRTGILSNQVFIPDVLIELKPSMGDDYPAVMRQVIAMKRRNSGYSRCIVIIGDYSGRGATLDQVTAMFGKSNIKLFLLSEIEDIAKSLL
ncbi:MAG: hypothetical protein KAX46_00480 [Chromatiaceae bacterium]|nr:hypothetical protein [Chromatiaceae bacterium]